MQVGAYTYLAKWSPSDLQKPVDRWAAVPCKLHFQATPGMQDLTCAGPMQEHWQDQGLDRRSVHQEALLLCRGSSFCHALASSTSLQCELAFQKLPS